MSSLSARLCSCLSLVYLLGLLSTSSCAYRRGTIPDITAADCYGESSVSLEPTFLPSSSAAARIEDQAGGAYDRSYYLRQAYADGTIVKSCDSVPLKGAEIASVLINMKRGELIVTGGPTPNLLDAEFEYTAVEPIPLLSYHTNGTERVVEVLGMGKDNSWRLNLSERVPVALKVESGGGTREFNFEDVPLTGFKLHAIGGSTTINLPGDHPYLNTLEIDQSQGSVGLIANGSFGNLQKANLAVCRGEFAASFTGSYDRLAYLELGSLSGDVDVDLTGCFGKICHIRVTATCGNCRLKLPAGLGVSVKIHHSCASICAVGMHKTWCSDAWVNPAYGKTENCLDIEVDSTCGKIDLLLDSCCCPPWIW
jgi:hypothetical protein